MSQTLKFVLLVIFIVAAVNLAFVLKRLLPMVKRVREIKRIKNNPDVISAEAEIVEINEQRLDQINTQYNVKLHYEVGYQKFYKDFILINKQSLRVGQKLTVMCDSFDPEKALIQDYTDSFGEDFGLKSTLFNFVIDIIVISVDVALNALSFITG